MNRTRRLARVIALAVLLLGCGSLLASDPSGASTGGIANVPAKTAGQPTLEELGAAVGQTRVSLNFVWVLMAGFLVMFMQAGAALTVPAEMNKLFGPTIGGSVWGLFGGSGFFLSGVAYDVSAFAIFLFQMVFMDTALTIPTGSMAERWKLSAFVIYAFVASGLIYPVFGCWAWGGGWLSTVGKYAGLGHGYVDFAGSGVVHLTGGVMALTGAYVLGPRIGKYVKGKAQAIPGHNIPMAVLGCLILAFGWFGFNAGSTLAGTDLRIAVVATNTMLASASGSFLAFLYTWKKFERPDTSMAVNGMLAGMVAITAPCAFVTAPVAVLIGAISGVLVVEAALFIENRMKIDDPVGAIAVHGVNGTWGLVALGLFADGTYGGGWNGGPAAGVTGLFYGDASQLTAQLVGIGANLLWVGATSLALFKVLDRVVGMRVTPEQEMQGLDFHEVSAPAYPGDGSPVAFPVFAAPSDRPVVAARVVPAPAASRK